MVAIAPAIAFAVHRVGETSGNSSLLAGPVKQFWGETTDQPLKVFGSTGELTYGIPFYLSNHPIAVHVLERPATTQEEALIEQNGVALVCPAIEPICMRLAKMHVAKSPFAKETQVAVSRSYLGSQGNSAHYLIVAIPPKYR